MMIFLAEYYLVKSEDSSVTDGVERDSLKLVSERRMLHKSPLHHGQWLSPTTQEQYKSTFSRKLRPQCALQNDSGGHSSQLLSNSTTPPLSVTVSWSTEAGQRCCYTLHTFALSCTIFTIVLAENCNLQ